MGFVNLVYGGLCDCGVVYARVGCLCLGLGLLLGLLGLCLVLGGRLL